MKFTLKYSHMYVKGRLHQHTMHEILITPQWWCLLPSFAGWSLCDNDLKFVKSIRTCSNYYAIKSSQLHRFNNLLVVVIRHDDDSNEISTFHVLVSTAECEYLTNPPHFLVVFKFIINKFAFRLKWIFISRFSRLAKKKLIAWHFRLLECFHFYLSAHLLDFIFSLRYTVCWIR